MEKTGELKEDHKLYSRFFESTDEDSSEEENRTRMEQSDWSSHGMEQGRSKG